MVKNMKWSRATDAFLENRRYSDDVLTSRSALNAEEETATSWRTLVGAFLIQWSVTSIISTYGVLFAALEQAEDDYVMGKKYFLVPALYLISYTFADPWFRTDRSGNPPTSRVLTAIGLFVVVLGILINCPTRNIILQALGYGVLSGAGSSLVLNQTEYHLKCLYPTHQGLVMTFYNVGTAIGHSSMPLIAYFLVLYYSYSGGTLVYVGIVLQGMIGIFLLFPKKVNETRIFRTYSRIHEPSLSDTLLWRTNGTQITLAGRIWRNPGIEAINSNVFESFTSQLNATWSPYSSWRPANNLDMIPEENEEEEEEEINAQFDTGARHSVVEPTPSVIDEGDTNAKHEESMLITLKEQISNSGLSSIAKNRYNNRPSWNVSRKHEEVVSLKKVLVQDEQETHSGEKIFTNGLKRSTTIDVLNEDIDSMIEEMKREINRKKENIPDEKNVSDQVTSKDKAAYPTTHPTNHSTSKSFAINSILHYVIIDPLNMSFRVRQFYPVLLLKTMSKLSLTVFASLLPLLAINHVPLCTLEAATFSVAVAGFAWLCFLVLTPWFNGITVGKQIYLYSAGCFVGALGLFVLSSVESRDELTLGSAVFGIGQGIMMLTATNIQKGPTSNPKVQVKLDKFTFCLILFLTLFLYAILMKANGIRLCFVAMSLLQTVSGIVWLTRPLITSCKNKLLRRTVDSDSISNGTL